MFARDIGAEEAPHLHIVPKPAPAPDRFARLSGLLLALRARGLAILAMALAFAVVTMPQLVSHASTQITIDTDVLFGSVNTWISTFLPIFAIGLGIAIAIAIIAIVGDSILAGLRRGITR